MNAPNASSIRFDTLALYDEMEAKRRRQGLSWAEVAAHVYVSGATLRRMKQRVDIVETDGMLQMVRWLGRAPESFCEGIAADPLTAGVFVADPGVPGILRVDSTALHAALDERRQERDLAWAQVSVEAGVWKSTLRGLPNGSRPLGARTNATSLVRMTQWLDRSVESFTTLCSS